MIVLLHYFERSCCLKTLIGSFVLLAHARLIASSVSSETKETDNEASWLACKSDVFLLFLKGKRVVNELSPSASKNSGGSHFFRQGEC